ncbi:hypothetical protein Q4S10_19735, partial [Morganella morganii]
FALFLQGIFYLFRILKLRNYRGYTQPEDHNKNILNLLYMPPRHGGLFYFILSASISRIDRLS